MARKYYVICDNDCLFESMTKEQIYDAIANATGNTPTSVDEAFITKILEQNKQESMKFWRGTQAEYNALQEVSADTYYIITDRDESDYMARSVYDVNGNGVVDNAERLGGVDADGFVKVAGEQSITGEKTFNNKVKVTGVAGSLTTRRAQMVIGDTVRDVSLYILPAAFSTYWGLHDDTADEWLIAKKKSTDADSSDGLILDGDDLGDFVVEHITQQYWTVRKWRSGFMEMWYKGYRSGISITTQWGSIYTTSSANTGIPPVEYPVEFISKPMVQLSLENSSGGDMWYVTTAPGDATQTPGYVLARATSQTNQSTDFTIYAAGRWK